MAKPTPFSLLLFFLFSFSAIAQNKTQNDSNYYIKFRDKLNIRTFLSQKYIHINIPSNGDIKDLEYKANPKLNLGAGFTYRWITLNFFNGFKFLNKKDETKGVTKGLNLQVHLYPGKWAMDLIFESPKGFYIDKKGAAGAGVNNYYYRGDIKNDLFGLSIYRVPNKEKFSYRAAISQTEWQKRSAGSFLFGGNVFHGSLQGDSALVPSLLANKYPEAGVKKTSYTVVGPGAGYAHTFVVDQHFFFTGSVVFNANLNFVKEEGTTINSKSTFNFSDVFKAAIGYNSPTWNFSANWLGQGLWIKGSTTNENYFFPSGQIRIVAAYKFDLHHHS